MTKREDVISILLKMRECKPDEWFSRFDSYDEGAAMVLEYLYSKIGSGVTHYASNIADSLNISRARVGTIVNRLKTKGYIKTMPKEEDQRIENIEITESGIEVVRNSHEELIGITTKVIEKLGMDKIEEFVNTCKEIKMVLEEECKNE